MNSIPEGLCPYCNVKLEPIPKRKKKCLFCGNYIYIRTLPITKIQMLVTEKEVKEIEKQWEEENKYSYPINFISFLKGFGVTDDDFSKCEGKLRLQFKQEPNKEDIIWALFNEQIIKNIKTKNHRNLNYLYYEQALFLCIQGKNCYMQLKLAAYSQLMDFKEIYKATKVRISGGKDSCEACKKMDGKIFTIEEAIKQMPIPCKECTHKLFNKNYSFCRCMYMIEDFK